MDEDQLSQATSAASSFKKRKLSISVAKNKHMTPQKSLVTPSELEKKYNNTIDRNRYGGGNLDEQSLRQLDRNSRIEQDQISTHSGLFTSKASEISSKKYNQRFPSIQPDERRKNAYITSDILSQSSRLSKVSKIISRAGSHLSGSQNPAATPSLKSSRVHDLQDAASAFTNRDRHTVFMNPADNLVQNRNDNRLVQEDLLEKILDRKRKLHLERQNAVAREQTEVNQVYADY